MNSDQLFPFAPVQGTPASPFDHHNTSLSEDQANGPRSLGSAAGSNSLTEGFGASNETAAQSQGSPVSMLPNSGAAAARPYAAAAAAVKAPWDDDDDDWNAPIAPAPAQKPALPVAAAAVASSPPASATSAAVVSPPQPSRPSQGSLSPFSASPAEPCAAPQLPPQHGDESGFIASSPPPNAPQDSPNRLLTPPEKSSAVNAAKMDVLNKQIASRTAAYDAATKEKESKVLAAAQEYINAQKAKREKEVAEAKASHKKEQQADTNKIEAYKKSGAVWNAVGMLVDLQKPNQYSKGTEQMRSILSTLNVTPAAAAAATAGGAPAAKK